MDLKSIFRKKKTNLKGKHVLITGAAQGIGLETAIQFAEAGSHLVLTDINEEKLAAAKRTIEEYGVGVWTYVVDVSDKEQVETVAKTVEKEIGCLDILINNAGVGHHGELDETSLNTWKKLIDVNLWGPLHHIYAFLPLMKEQGSGHIVNVSSGQAFFRLPTWGAYAAIKLAIGVISEILHYELKKYNIKVTTVYPYMVNTGFYTGVETKGLGSKLSMALLPLYSQKPETVAKIIFKAVKKGKRIEMVNVLNHFAKYMHVLSPVSNAINNALTWALSSKNKEDKEKDYAILETLAGLFETLGDQVNNFAGEVGFCMDEIMSGDHEFVDEERKKEGKLPMEFKVTWGAESLTDWMNPFNPEFMTNTLEGTVTIGGLCEDTPCEGVLELRYFDQQKIRYTFDFEVDGEDYRFVGEKRNIYPWNLPYSHTCCFGELRKADTNELISNSITHFRWETLPEFLGSFQLLKDTY